jgi:hypothetical protein
MALNELVRSETEIDAALPALLLVGLDDDAGAELLLLLLLLLHAEMSRAAAAAPATAVSPALAFLLEDNDVPRLFEPRHAPWARSRPHPYGLVTDDPAL